MPVLNVQSLTKTFGRLRAVDDLSLRVERGQLFGLLGPNGSGKTTTLACVLGLLRPDRGSTSVLGTPSAAIHRTAGRVATVFDATDLVAPLTALQNLEYTRRLLGHQGGRGPAEVLELVGLGSHAKQRAGHLSLGQKRRLSIARALLGKPELMVLDEPLSGLDAVGVEKVLELFRNLRDDGLTIVLSSHRLHEMDRVVTHAAVMADGKLLRSGSLGELLAGAPGRVRIAATPVERAREILTSMPQVERVELRGDGELTVTTRGSTPAAMNRALLEAGCEVSALVPERATLAGLFTSLVMSS